MKSTTVTSKYNPVNANQDHHSVKFGWKKDKPDDQDLYVHHLASTLAKAGVHTATPVLPKAVTLVAKMPPVKNQGDLGACTAFATSAAFEYVELNKILVANSFKVFSNISKKTLEGLANVGGSSESKKEEGKKEEVKKEENHFKGVVSPANNVRTTTTRYDPSELFQYYNSRVVDGETDLTQDTGASIRSSIMAINEYGMCPESLWPYVNISSNFSKKPPQNCYTNANGHRSVSYSRLAQDPNQLKAWLSAGIPFVCGIMVYDSFMSDAVAVTGAIPNPNTNSESLLGGHAIIICGYDDVAQRFTFQNSWGTGWGRQGRGTLPYSYILNPNLASDFWGIRTISAPL